MPNNQSENIEAFIDTLPDPAAARVFMSRLDALDPALSNDCKRDPLLLSRMLTLAGHSPFLAETLLRHPEHIGWLKAETTRDFDRVKSTEQLSEELARFVTRMIDADDPTRLARFKRREFLRIYLRDCLGIATLSEVTEELSNLADVILDYGLARAHQEMVNLHGAPLTHDERGRIEKAELAIVALGKLGCRELNYASDIDLLFLFSGYGETAGDGRSRASAISNKQFFTAVAERVVQLIGRSSSEGAVYRIDLRLRPYGRDGEMISEIERASDYYRNRAHNWERQALIRARASAGSEQVVTHFLDMVRDAIFTRDALPDTLEGVRRAKEKIDRKEAARMRGFNVKLGPGGIREIEFIAQALQLKHGGREPWVRSAQTLIVLARLAEKQYLTEPERARLSAAYTFLRTVEHRLQMEHGAQTHTLPASRTKLALLARRCGYVQSDDPATPLVRDLERHTAAVRAVYDRVFIEGAQSQSPVEARPEAARADGVDDETARLVKQAVARLHKVIGAGPAEAAQFWRDSVGIERVLTSALPCSINPSRALRHLAAWAESLATYSTENFHATGWAVRAGDWATLIERLILVLSSQYLSHLLVSRPLLVSALVEDVPAHTPADFIRVLRDEIYKESDPASKPDALRRAWYRLVIEIGYRDMSAVSSPSSVAEDKELPAVSSSETPQLTPDHALLTTDYGLRTNDHLRAINLAQTALAEAVLRIASEIALESIGITRVQPGQLPFTILGLGRLGHAGMDYGSDLDLLVVFDDDQEWPPPNLAGSIASGPAGSNTPHEFYAMLTAQIVRVLSSITREGLLYRCDLRLRPEGKSGPVALGLGGLVAYITNRASAWEHSAYLKAREVAGDLQFGERARIAICEASFGAASRNELLREELRDIRARLVKEKARGARPNIKWGRGGMTDVYFVTRYLQLRDRIYFPPERGTTALIAHLGELGALGGEETRALFEGYTFLRRLDHWMRLLLDRPSPVLPASSVALRDITRALGLSSVEDFEQAFAQRTTEIREVYDRIFDEQYDRNSMTEGLST
jgi:[glutamine synthetase] adenylyltransferase / [glutamine synthetase]-adenylyl-L-tyrosine phosphorylase